jgi:phosphotransferase system HPr (HPr) family protein
MSNNRTTLTIDNALGLHARPAALFVQTANKYPDCEIKVAKDGNVVNGKSIMGLMMLAAAQGTEITIEASGKDADMALQELAQLVKNKFGEEE